MSTRILFSYILAIVFVLLFASFSFLTGLYGTLFDRDFVQEELVAVLEAEIDSRIPEEVQIGSSGVIDGEKVSVVVNDVFSRDELNKFVGSGYVDFFEENRINLQWILEQNQVMADQFADLIFAELDSCSDDSFLTFPDCLPENFSKEDLSAQIYSVLDREVFKDIPASVDFSLSGVSVDLLMNPIFYGSLAFLLVLVLFLISILVYPNEIRVLSWLSGLLFFASSFVLILLSFLNGVLPQVEFFGGLFAIYLQRILILVLPVFVVSLLVWIFSLIKRRFKKYESQ